MAKIKSCNTKPELIVRSTLHKMGFRFRLHRKDLPGKPDVVLPKYKIALFVHGCFWHRHEGCKKSHLPASHTEYWEQKLSRNKKRDAINQIKLNNIGWNTVIIWECETKEQDTLQQILSRRIHSIINSKEQVSNADCT